MTSDFLISMDDDNGWLSGDQGPEEIRHTSAFLQIKIGNHIATLVHDDWSRWFHKRVRLSAYPLALWFASSWWRLRWEPAPSGEPNLSWRMAHALSAAGGGFLWPRLTLATDGETVEAVCRPSEPLSSEPLQYLANFHETIAIPDFERAIDSFMELVLTRLGAVRARDTELQRLWREVLEERADQQMARWRKLEAQLGFEADEAPEGMLIELETLASKAGEAAVAELASACAGSEPAAALSKVVELAESPGTDGKVTPPTGLSELLRDPLYQAAAPWQRGWRLARDARKGWNLGAEALSDLRLAELLSVHKSTIDATNEGTSVGPLSLAIRSNSPERLVFQFRKRNHTGRRFEAVRLLADHLLTPASERWLPATDTRTARQKVQRAFAAEFLCPIEALKSFLGGNLSDEKIEEAGEQFGVSSLSVKSLLVYNRLLPPFELEFT